MPRKTTEEDEDLLEDLGVDTESQDQGGPSARVQRIIAGFEEIERFVKEQRRMPEHGESRDIFERLYATRLDQIRSSQECREALKDRDPQGLIGSEGTKASIQSDNNLSDEELVAELSSEGTEDDITRLKHVRPWQEIRAAEEVASRSPCREFDKFRPIFEKVQEELETGVRKTFKFEENADVAAGDLFILQGQKLFIAECGKPFTSEYGRPDRRLRVVYDNGTESDLLVRSLQRALYKDKNSRRITDPNLGPLFQDEELEKPTLTGHIYVLRSKSTHPFIVKNQDILHKIGVTGGDVNLRIVNAKKDPTYLLADVEVVATFKIFDMNRKLLDDLVRRFFSSARLSLEIKDRFGFKTEPREWFLVPLPVIDQAIQLVKNGSIIDYEYDHKKAKIVKINAKQ